MPSAQTRHIHRCCGQTPMNLFNCRHQWSILWINLNVWSPQSDRIIFAWDHFVSLADLINISNLPSRNILGIIRIRLRCIWSMCASANVCLECNLELYTWNVPYMHLIICARYVKMDRAFRSIQECRLHDMHLIYYIGELWLYQILAG